MGQSDLSTLKEEENKMAEDLSQILMELGNRNRIQNLFNFKTRNMTSIVHLVLASVGGVLITMVAMYISTFLGSGLDRTALHHAGYNLMVAPERHTGPSLLQGEALAAMKAAVTMKTDGKRDKALRLFQQAIALAPHHSDILLHYGEFLENEDIVQAEHLYNRALSVNPGNSRALTNRQRTLPKVKQLDWEMLNVIDEKRRKLFSLPTGSLSMKRAIREAYFQHIFHSNAIEGNTMTLSMTRAIVETRMAISGKSILEHNEVIGLDEAMKFINGTLVQKSESISVNDILAIHKRVLGHAHPLEAGVYRRSQVFVSEHVPPGPLEVEQHMDELKEWLLSREPEILHPIEFAALAHYKLVYIHPFTDGNGRTARLLMNTILMRAGFPPVIIRFQDRHDYYKHLNQANHGDVRPFIRFVAACTERTIDAYLASTTIIPLGHRTRELTDAHVNMDDSDDLSFHVPKFPN